MIRQNRNAPSKSSGRAIFTNDVALRPPRNCAALMDATSNKRPAAQIERRRRFTRTVYRKVYAGLAADPKHDAGVEAELVRSWVRHAAAIVGAQSEPPLVAQLVVDPGTNVYNAPRVRDALVAANDAEPGAAGLCLGGRRGRSPRLQR